MLTDSFSLFIMHRSLLCITIRFVSVLTVDELLLKLCSQVSPKWRQFGFALRIPTETLNELSSYQEEDRLSEIANYWMKQHQGQLTWREVAQIMKEIDLNDLAEEILSDGAGIQTYQFYYGVNCTHMWYIQLWILIQQSVCKKQNLCHDLADL